MPYLTPAPVPAGKTEADGVYDAAAVLAAWQSGNDAGLSPKNLAILNAARALLSEAVTEDMSDYEKELAVHDWLIDHAAYDEASLSHNPSSLPDPDNENPYGLLVHGLGVCRGYCSTFQLLMDMLDIECITVDGYGRDEGEHAWNMVRLDGDWYCVDVTWDDPLSSVTVPASRSHQYFNVTSNYLRSTDHHWDDENVPEATATTLRWRS